MRHGIKMKRHDTTMDTGEQGRQFSFSRGGFDRLPRGGAKYEKYKILLAKTQKVTIFQNQGGGGKCPPLPPQMTSLLVSGKPPSAECRLYNTAGPSLAAP